MGELERRAAGNVLAAFGGLSMLAGGILLLAELGGWCEALWLSSSLFYFIAWIIKP